MLATQSSMQLHNSFCPFGDYHIITVITNHTNASRHFRGGENEDLSVVRLKHTLNILLLWNTIRPCGSNNDHSLFYGRPWINGTQVSRE